MASSYCHGLTPPCFPHSVFDAKRLIGRKFSDQIVQNDCKLWPFKVRSGAHDIPEICGKSNDSWLNAHAVLPPMLFLALPMHGSQAC